MTQRQGVSSSHPSRSQYISMIRFTCPSPPTRLPRVMCDKCLHCAAESCFCSQTHASPLSTQNSHTANQKINLRFPILNWFQISLSLLHTRTLSKNSFFHVCQVPYQPIKKIMTWASTSSQYHHKFCSGVKADLPRKVSTLACCSGLALQY